MRKTARTSKDSTNTSSLSFADDPEPGLPRSPAPIEPVIQTASDVTQYTTTATERRIDEVIEEMRKLTWSNRRDTRSFARKWGISIQHAGWYVTQAKKILAGELRETDGALVSIGETAKKIVDDCMASKKLEHRKVALDAIKFLSTLAPGVVAPTKHIVQVEESTETLEELIAIAKALAEEQEKDILNLERQDDGSYSEPKA